MARRLRQVVDLYTEGAVVVLRDELPVWVQPLNPFEQDTARNEAGIAKSRMVLALKNHSEEERVTVHEFFFADGLDGARERLVEAKVNENSPKIFTDIRHDPEWAERMLILDRGDEGTAKPLTDAEQELLQKIALEYSAELGARLASEREYQAQHYASMEEEPLWEEYYTWYVDRRAGEAMLSEFRQHQLLFGVRVCEANLVDGSWDHGNCDGHRERLFPDREELREAPTALLETLFSAIDNIELTVDEAKNSDRQGSSSDSSPLPSEAEESTASTPQETPVAPPGSSSTPSPTDSPSLAGVS